MYLRDPKKGMIFQSERGNLWRSEQKGFGLRWAQVPNQNVITQKKEGRYE
jgi:hypothetical protein